MSSVERAPKLSLPRRDWFGVKNHPTFTAAEKTYFSLSAREIHSNRFPEIKAKMDSLVGAWDGQIQFYETIINILELYQQFPDSNPDTCRSLAHYYLGRIAHGDALSQAISGKGSCIEWALLLKLYAELYQFTEIDPGSVVIVPTGDYSSGSTPFGWWHNHYAIGFRVAGNDLVCIFPGLCAEVSEITNSQTTIAYIKRELFNYEVPNPPVNDDPEFEQHVRELAHLLLMARRAYLKLLEFQQQS